MQSEFNFVESLIVTILGVTICAAGIISQAPIDINVLGGLAVVVGIVGMCVNRFGKKSK